MECFRVRNKSLLAITFITVLYILVYRTMVEPEVCFLRRNVQFTCVARPDAIKEMEDECKILIASLLLSGPGLVRMCSGPQSRTFLIRLPLYELYIDVPAFWIIRRCYQIMVDIILESDIETPLDI